MFEYRTLHVEDQQQGTYCRVLRASRRLLLPDPLNPHYVRDGVSACLRLAFLVSLDILKLQYVHDNQSKFH